MTVKVSKLANGLRVATDTMPSAHTAFVQIRVGSGSRHEPRAHNGLAHSVEHNLFEGTKRYSNFGLSAAIEDKGGEMNAETEREDTWYHVHVPPQKAMHAFGVIADMVAHSQVHKKGLSIQKQIVAREISEYHDMPEEDVKELLYKKAFPRQKIGRFILGTPETLERMTRRAHLDFIKEHYCASNMVVALVGKVDHDNAVAAAEHHLGHVPRGNPSRRGKALMKSGILRQAKDSEHIYVAIGYSAPSLRDADKHTMNFLNSMLGESFTSRLYSSIVSKSGMAYSTCSQYEPFHDAGVLLIRAGITPKRVPEFFKKVGKEIASIKRKVTKTEFDRALAQWCGWLLKGQDDLERRGNDLASQIITFNRPISIKERMASYQTVKREDVREMAYELFSHRPTIVLLGPQHDAPSEKEIYGSLGFPELRLVRPRMSAAKVYGSTFAA